MNKDNRQKPIGINQYISDKFGAEYCAKYRRTKRLFPTLFFLFLVNPSVLLFNLDGMSIQWTAQSVLDTLGNLYQIIDSSIQHRGHISINDSENLLYLLCKLSQLIHHIHQTGMCGQASPLSTNMDCQQNYLGSQSGHYLNLRSLGPVPHTGQPCEDYAFHQPMRIIANDPHMATFFPSRDLIKKKRSRSKPSKKKPQKKSRNQSRSTDAEMEASVAQSIS